MYKPNGIAIVTAGLAGLALFHVVWGPDTRQAETWLQLDAPTPRAALDFGTTFQLHSGAWRAWPAPVEEEPVKTPVALPVPEMPARVAREAAMAPDQSAASILQTAEGEPGTALPTAAAGLVTFPEPAAPPAAKAPIPPPPAEGRMALGGPEGQGAPAPTPAAQPDHSAPRTHDRAPEVDAAPAASESKFGPAIFKQLDGRGS
jgi:hypothetical protein